VQSHVGVCIDQANHCTDLDKTLPIVSEAAFDSYVDQHKHFQAHEVISSIKLESGPCHHGENAYSG
jgi:hypothetical protein